MVRIICDRCGREFDDSSTALINNTLLCVDCYAGWQKVWKDFMFPTFQWAKDNTQPTQIVTLPTPEKKVPNAKS